MLLVATIAAQWMEDWRPLQTHLSALTAVYDSVDRPRREAAMGLPADDHLERLPDADLVAILVRSSEYDPTPTSEDG